jgi:hypothetical protein
MKLWKMWQRTDLYLWLSLIGCKSPYGGWIGPIYAARIAGIGQHHRDAHFVKIIVRIVRNVCYS